MWDFPPWPVFVFCMNNECHQHALRSMAVYFAVRNQVPIKVHENIKVLRSSGEIQDSGWNAYNMSIHFGTGPKNIIVRVTNKK